MAFGFGIITVTYRSNYADIKRYKLGASVFGRAGYVGGICLGRFSLKIPMFGKVFIGVIVPIILIVAWGKYLAPASKTRLSAPWLQLTKNILFFSSALLLYASGHKKIAVEFAVIILVNQLLAILWRQ